MMAAWKYREKQERPDDDNHADVAAAASATNEAADDAAGDDDDDDDCDDVDDVKSCAIFSVLLLISYKLNIIRADVLGLPGRLRLPTACARIFCETDRERERGRQRQRH